MSIAPFDEFRSALAHRYQIEREIGHGGMATVYLAHDLKLGRRVALKVLRPEVAHVLGEERFKREIELAAPLTHPHILPFIDSDEAAGRLFYVMPFVEGGTLADRLARGPRPTLTEALEIIRQVAAGLSYAHSIGVIHRDIKPANILLATGHAWLSDFGIARMVREAIGDTAERLTETGLAIGTVEYMPPEQLRGASKVDGRADEYALACVLFEMLTGHLPSSSPGRMGALRQELRAAGLALPGQVERALERALSLDTDARFPSVAEFAAALEGAVEPRRVRSGTGPLLWKVVGACLGAGALIALGVWRFGGWSARGLARALPDTTQIVVFPFDHQGPLDTTLGEQDRIMDGLSRWGGITLVDRRRIREAMGHSRQGALTSATAMSVAAALGAGRYITGTVSRLGDSIRVQATLYDLAHGGRQLAGSTIRMAPDFAGADSSFPALADALLFQTRAPPAVRSHSLPATQAFLRGQVALQQWNLGTADSAFAAAAAFDPLFAEASLWLGLTRVWSGAPTAQWKYAAEQAFTGRAVLSPRGQAMADALIDQARGDLGRACPRWTMLTQRFPSDFAAWYGAATCQRLDDAVLRDPRTASGWRFRTSYHAALKAYQRAFELDPAVLLAHRTDSYQALRYLFRTSPDILRSGRAVAPDSGAFEAVPEWRGDSLVYIPFESGKVTGGSGRVPTSLDEAVRHQRELFLQVAMGWRAAMPQSPDAVEALAIALDLLGDPAALDTLRRARGLMTDPPSRLRTAAAEVWLEVKYAMPADTAALRQARVLADSLLTAFPPDRDLDPTLLGGLAALTGRAGLAAAYARDARPRDPATPSSPLVTSGPALIAFAALGGPAESLMALEDETSAAIDNTLPTAERADARLEWLAQAAALAFPEYLSQSLLTMSGRGDYLVDVIADWHRGHPAEARDSLHALQAKLRQLQPTVLTFDALYPEAALLQLLGESSEAAKWLDRTLTRLPQVDPRLLSRPARAGALMRAALLRSDLAAELGDPRGAIRWRVAVRILWKNADPFLQARLRARTGTDR